ncbi:MAG: peptidylprolyl isomerase [Polyangiaceae bacterium]
MRSVRRMSWVGVAVLVASVVAAAACDPKPLEQRAKESAGDQPGKLTKEEASKVLAKVGKTTITLGDYAAALERMNEFDRMRYQTVERRRDLLNDMIDLELLAQEAERRGLDKSPEVQETVRQILRDTMVAETRKGVPIPASIPADQVKAYYEAHKAEYREPERRRVSAIVLTDKKEAEKVLPDAKKASPMEWGKLVQKYSPGAAKPSPSQPLETLGDLGIVGPTDDPKGDNPRVPEAVRAAVFSIQGEPGSTLDSIVEADGKFYIVRMAGKTPAHERTLAEADRTIRSALLQEMAAAAERALEEELKKQYPVQIDDAALANVKALDDAKEQGDVRDPRPAPSASAPR